MDGWDCKVTELNDSVIDVSGVSWRGEVVGVDCSCSLLLQSTRLLRFLPFYFLVVFRPFFLPSSRFFHQTSSPRF